MPTRRILQILLLFAILATANAQFQKIVGEANEVTITADDVQYSQDNSTVIAKGKVRIVYGNLTLEADEAELNNETKNFAAQGNVSITTPEKNGAWKSPYLKGNLDKQLFQFGPYRLTSDMWFLGGEHGSATVGKSTDISKAWLTTCELEKPHYSLNASTIKYNDDKTFSAKHVTLRFFNIPVFYLPYIWGSTESTRGFILRPGYSGKLGLFLRVGYVWQLTKNTTSDVYVDLMTKRGVGIGGDIKYAQNEMKARLSAYGVKDQDAPRTDKGYNRRFRYTNDRFRINGRFRNDPKQEQNQLDDLNLDTLTIKSNLDYMSDIDMLEDWFKREYRHTYQSKSFLDLAFSTPELNAELNLRPRINDFYTVVETLPELTISTPRNFGKSPFYSQDLMKIGYYSVKWRNFKRSRLNTLGNAIYDARIHDDPHNYSSARWHYQRFSYMPLTILDDFVLTPRMGVALTYYGRSSGKRVTTNDLANMYEADNSDNPYSRAAVKPYDAKGGAQMRFAFETGAELKTTIYSDWMNSSSDWFEIDGIRHVLEPYINYTYSPSPTKDKDYIYYFDDLDRLEKQHFFRLGLDQRLLTRKASGPLSIVRYQSYMDFHLIKGEESNSYAGDFGNRIEFTPLDYLKVWGALIHEMGEGKINRSEAGIRYGKEDLFNFSLRYIRRNSHISRSAYSLGSTLVDLSGESSYLKKRFESSEVVVADLLIPVNPLTKLAITAEYDFEKQRVSEHKYEIRRNLHCWDMVFGFGWDNNDFEAYIMFQLVAFPSVRLDLSL